MQQGALKPSLIVQQTTRLGLITTVIARKIVPSARSSRMRPPDPTLFRAFGYISLSFDTILLFLFLLKLRSRLLFHGPDYSSLFWMSMYWGSIGIGLVHLRKWAVELFISTLTIGPFLIVGSILKVPLTCPRKTPPARVGDLTSTVIATKEDHGHEERSL